MNTRNIRPLTDPSKPKVYIETYGCQMNVNDSEVILSILQDAGYVLTEDIEEADIILARSETTPSRGSGAESTSSSFRSAREKEW